VLPAAVRHDRSLSQTAKLLYAEISSLAQADGYCWATDRYFAELLGCSVKTVSRTLAMLRDQGYIRMERTANAQGPERHIYCGLDPAQGVMDKNDHNPVHNPDHMDKNVHNPPIKENNKKCVTGARTREDKPDEIGGILDGFAGEDVELRSALEDFREDRRRRKKPMKTPLAASRFVKRLRSLSGGDRAVMLVMIDKAIERGLDTVYPLPPDEMPKAVPRSLQDAEDVIDWAPGVTA
jgi:hypothetical protein